MSSTLIRGAVIAGAVFSMAFGLAVASSLAGPGEESPQPKAKSKRVNPAVGDWSGTGVDDTYGVTGTVRFEIKRNRNGRELRNLVVGGMTGDCADGVTRTDRGFSIPRANIRPTGLMRGHAVLGKPGDRFISVVGYDVRFKKRAVVGGRLYDNVDIDNENPTGATNCRVPPITFSATSQGG